MRTLPESRLFGSSRFVVYTKHGRSGGPTSGAHSMGSPFTAATDVKVPHSCTTTPCLPDAPCSVNPARNANASVNFIAVLLSGLHQSPPSWAHARRTSTTLAHTPPAH